jgi:hypothetical protein
LESTPLLYDGRAAAGFATQTFGGDMISRAHCGIAAQGFAGLPQSFCKIEAAAGPAAGAFQGFNSYLQ